MSRRRWTLDDLRRRVLFELDDRDWLTPTQISDRLGIGGLGWYKLALVLERLVVDGDAEIKTPRSKVRKFRRVT